MNKSSNRPAIRRSEALPNFEGRERRLGRPNVRLVLLQIEEFSRVTRYPAIRGRIHPAQAGRLLNAVRSLSVLLERLPASAVSRDPHDDYLFAMAEASEADYLVTGDKAGVLALRRHGKTEIVTTRKMATILKL
jgi:predicted nucleic acid-binding protein